MEQSHAYRAGTRSSYAGPGRGRQQERHRIQHARQRKARTPSYVRLLKTAAIILAVTWLPGIVGDSIGPGSLGWWGRESGYLGLSWLLPALLIGIAADRSLRRAGSAWHTPAGWLAGVTAAIVLLLGAAQIIGA